MSKKIFHTDAAPKAIGTYSQAVQAGDLIFVSGQIPLVPETMQMISEDFAEQTHQVFKNMNAIIKETGLTTAHIVKLTVYLTDLSHFAQVNEIMAQYFQPPYPARAALGVASLPKNSKIEIEAILYKG